MRIKLFAFSGFMYLAQWMLIFVAAIAVLWVLNQFVSLIGEMIGRLM